MTDNNAALMALKSGSLDIAEVDSKEVENLKNDYTILNAPQNMVQLFALNNSVAPLNDVRVRQAINYAVDKDEIINTVLNGNGTKLDTFLSPVMEAYYNKDSAKYSKDIEKSKALLKEAGLENGFTFTVTVPSNYKTHVDTAQILKDQLSKVGITLDIKLVEWAQWLDTVYKKADYESTVVAHTGKLDPQDFLNRFDSRYGKNYFKYSNKEYDKLIDEAAGTNDTAKRKECYNKCQKILSDDAAAVFIQDPNIIYAINKNVEGLKNYPIRFIDASTLKLKK